MAIVKSNKLIETSYQLGSREQFFILFLISKIDSVHDRNLVEFTIHYQEIARILNFDGRKRVANYSDVFKLMDNLNSKSIHFEDDEKEGAYTWITGLERVKKTNMFTFSINKKLKPYLLELRKHFTRYNIVNVVHLNSHAIRMYEILKRYQYQDRKITKVVLEVESQLKKWLGLESKYSQYYEFKRWILLDSQKQLKKFTDIAFEFEPATKVGKKIIALEFTIFENEPTGIPESLGQLNEISLVRKSTFPIRHNIGNNAPGELSFSHQEKVLELSWSQKKAYDFLVEKEVNKAFIVDKVLNHVQIKYEPLQGFEDMYIRIVWTFFIKKTTSKNLAPAFVTWWKKGRLTEAELHAKHIEEVTKLRTRLSEDERSLRIVAKNMSFTNFESYQKELDNSTTKVDITVFEGVSDKLDMSQTTETITTTKSKSFDFIVFKKNYPQVYKELYQKVLAEYKKLAGQAFDKNKFEKSIMDNTKQKCKEWLDKHPDSI